MTDEGANSFSLQSLSANRRFTIKTQLALQLGKAETKRVETMIPYGPQLRGTPANQHGRRNRLPVLLCAGLLLTQPMNGAEERDGFFFTEAPEAVETRPGPPAGPAGTLSFQFVLDGIETTLELPHRAAGRGYTEGTLAELPFGRAWLFFGAGGGGLNLAWENAEGESLLAQMSLSRLKGSQPYHLAIAWDFEKDLLRMWLNGVDQGDLLHSRAGSNITPGALTDTLKVGGGLRDREFFEWYDRHNVPAGKVENSAPKKKTLGWGQFAKGAAQFRGAAGTLVLAIDGLRRLATTP